MSFDGVRRIYERHPYPRETREWKTTRCHLPPVEWINAVWTREWKPDRILVAGCGTGAEAFALRRKFPHAEITAVDFSPRSIALARDSQRQLRGRRTLSFVVADLADRRFRNIVGCGFDFVTCHGVLSYVRRPVVALENLADVLAPDGALYLGVNGPDHFSTPIRAALPTLGIDPAELKDLSAVRRVLELCDAIRERPSHERVTRLPENRLAGDLFGPLILNLPSAAWIAMAGEAGLNFQSSFAAYRKFRRLMEDDLLLLLWPKSHAEAIQIVDVLSPAPFHQLLFTRRRKTPPPWNRRKDLGPWKPSFTSLFRAAFPKRAAARTCFQSVTLKGPAVETRIDLHVAASEVAALRQCDGTMTVDEILSGSPSAESHMLTNRLLYSLYQLLVLRVDKS